MTIDEMIDVLKAAKEGKVIQVRGRSLTDWHDITDPFWNFESFEYRVKPAPREVFILKDIKEESVWATTLPLITTEQWERLSPDDQTRWTRFVEAE